MFICYRNKLEHSIYWFKYVFCFEIIRSLQSSWLFNRLTFCSKTARFSTSSRTFPSNSIFSLYKLIFSCFYRQRGKFHSRAVSLSLWCYKMHHCILPPNRNIFCLRPCMTLGCFSGAGRKIMVLNFYFWVSFN